MTLCSYIIDWFVAIAAYLFAPGFFLSNKNKSNHIYRKLLEGEETRIGTGMTYSAPSITAGAGQGYGYQTRIYSSSSKGSKKEGKEEDQQQESKSGGKMSHREVYEETVVTTKKIEKQPDASDNTTNQKN